MNFESFTWEREGGIFKDKMFNIIDWIILTQGAPAIIGKFKPKHSTETCHAAQRAAVNCKN